MAKNSIVFMMDYRGDQLQIGGTSNYLKLLAPRVRDLGFDVRVAMPYSNRTEDVLDFMSEQNITVDNVDISPQFGNVFDRIYAAYSYFSRVRPDLAHFILPWWNSCEYGILGARLASIGSRIVTYQSFPEKIDEKIFKGVKGFLRLRRHLFTCHSVHKAISVSEINKHRLINNKFYLSNKVKVIRNMIESCKFSSIENSIDFRKIWGIGDHKTIITVIGYLEPIKGHKYLFDALPNIVKVHPNVIVLVVGDGELREYFHKQVRELNVEENVLFVGWQNDIPNILSASDMLILPSLSEGLPFVIPEAMAAGLPIVSTRVGGIPEAIVDGQTGYLVDPKSSMEIAEAVIKMLDNPERMLLMGSAGQVRAITEFDVSRMVLDTCDLYNDVLLNGLIDK